VNAHVLAWVSHLHVWVRGGTSTTDEDCIPRFVILERRKHMETMITIQNAKERRIICANNLLAACLILFFSFDGCKKSPENLAVTQVETLFRDSLRYYNKDRAIEYFHNNEVDSAVFNSKKHD
jgi:hypothetical protein